jgi:hypothetical protein
MLEGIGDTDDPSFDGDLRPMEPVGLALTVEAFVVRPNDWGEMLKRFDTVKAPITEGGMARIALGEYRIGTSCQQPNVMKHSAVARTLDRLGRMAQVSSDPDRKRADRTEMFAEIRPAGRNELQQRVTGSRHVVARTIARRLVLDPIQRVVGNVPKNSNDSGDTIRGRKRNCAVNAR